MAWCRQARGHYLSQWWPRSLSPYAVTRPHWIKIHRQLTAFFNSTKKWLHYLYNAFNTWVINPVYLHEISCNIPELAIVQRHLVLYKHLDIAYTLMLVRQPTIFFDCSISPVTSKLWIPLRYSPSGLLLLLYVANSSVYISSSTYLYMSPVLYQNIYQDLCT